MCDINITKEFEKFHKNIMSVSEIALFLFIHQGFITFAVPVLIKGIQY